MERVVLVGSGGFGRCWWPALVELRSAFTVVAVVEPDMAERAAAGVAFDLPPTALLAPDAGNWSEFEPTLVIDSSPPWFHPTNAATAFASGADLLVAKPMAPTFAQATEMVRLAGQSGKRVAVAQQMRYFPSFLALRDKLRDESLGRPSAVRIRMALDGRGWEPGMAWRLAMDHPLLLEAGIHHFDLMRWCLDDEVVDVSAISWNPSWSPFSGHASVAAVLRTERGTVIDYRATFAPGQDPLVRFDSGWDVYCEEGLISVRDGGLYIADAPGSPGSTDEPVPLEDLNRALLEEWLRARRTGTSPPFSGEDNLRSMAVLDAALGSVTNLPTRQADAASRPATA